MDFTRALRRWSQVFRTLLPTSFGDSHSAGVPQIVLPLWTDTYNYAQLAEQTVVGIWGCRETPPDWTSDCLRDDVVKVALGPDSMAFRAKAKEVSAAAREQGVGREIWARIIAKLARSGRGNI